MWTSKLEEIVLNDDTSRQTFIQRLLQSTRNKVDTLGRTVLHYAVENNDVSAAKYNIKRGYSMNIVDNAGKTPIDIALEKKDALMLQMLAKQIRNIYIDQEMGRKWLRTVIDDSECGKLLPAVLFPKMKITTGDDIEFANILINEKCDLCYAISFGKPTVMRMLIDQGFSVNAKNGEGNTALHIAVHSGNVENVKFLLDRKANVNAKNNKGETPMNHEKNTFATAQDQQILKLLIDHGSDLCLYDENNRWQMYRVLRSSPKEAVEILLSLKTIFHARDNEKRTILHHLPYNRNPGVFALLISREFDANVRDESGCTPLFNAAITTNGIACQILINKGADVNAISNTRRCVPLFCAIQCMESANDKQLIEVLLEHGADAQVLNNIGETVFTFLLEENLPEVLEILLGHFALIESLGTVIIQQIRDKIEANDLYKTKYDLYKNRLEEMKVNRIYKDITLFKLLTDDERKVAGYMRNTDLLLKIKNFDSKYHINFYCNKQLNKRITSAIELSELVEKASEILYHVINSIITFDSYVVYEIISYLNREDLLILTSI